MPGDGVGHLFKIDGRGTLVADLRLGEGTIYHPGGIDYDGTSIWVPVAEYRPNSRSIIYRVDPATMKATEVFRFADHIGAIVHNTDDHTLHGVSWGSRRFYRWTLDRDGRVTNADADPARLRTLNPSHYVDYQDCKYVGAPPDAVHRRHGNAPRIRHATPFRLGGIDLVDLADGRPLPSGAGAAVDRRRSGHDAQPGLDRSRLRTGLRGYFMPEDEQSTIYVYDVRTEER